MPEIYEEFIVYVIENTGDRTRLDITPEELQYHLNPKQVLIIICDDLRRIFIWKGAKSPVRKRFISSRVAQDLQRDLIQDSRYHKCKIISIDQGDELQEFLNAFRLESMEVAIEKSIIAMENADEALEIFRRGSGDDRYPYPYVFKPPESPDDLALAPRVQLHASPKKKDPEEKIICQFCGRELTKEEHLNHSCKKKPKNA